jgi:hypothetical protein
MEVTAINARAAESPAPFQIVRHNPAFQEGIQTVVGYHHFIPGHFSCA